MRAELHNVVFPGLKDRVVIITGAGQGIGRVFAKSFAKAGARAVIAELNEKKAATVSDEIMKAGGQALAVTTDVADEGSITEMVEVVEDEFGRIDVLINNAGGLIQRLPVESMTDELFDQVINLNVRSAMMCTSAAAAQMKKQGTGGAIINVTSIAARHGGGPGAVLYASAKGFVSTMTRGHAKELVKDKIRVNAVAPGVIMTPFHERFSTPQMLEGFKATIPMNRLGTPDECAGAFLFLASEQMSGYMTGQILEVNGGQYMP